MSLAIAIGGLCGRLLRRFSKDLARAMDIVITAFHIKNPIHVTRAFAAWKPAVLRPYSNDLATMARSMCRSAD